MSNPRDSPPAKTPPGNVTLTPTSSLTSPNKVRPLNPNALAHVPGSQAHSEQPVVRREWAPNQRWGEGTVNDSPSDTPAPAPGSGWEVTGSSAPQQQPASWFPQTTNVNSDTEYYQARNAISQLPRAALVQVLNAVLDDYPQLATTIRFRCEKHLGGTGATSQPPQPQSWQDAPPLRRKNSTRREEEYEMCCIHGILRSTKHLQFNANGQKWECIPGFHCLESSPGTSPVKSGTSKASSMTPTKASTSPPVAQPLDAKSNAGTSLLRSSPNPAPRNADDPDVARLESLLSSLRS